MNPEKQKQLIENASKLARSNFRYIWRERFWDMRRETPICQYMGILCTISEERENGEKVREQLWLTDILCDGKYVHGAIQANPNQLQTVPQGAFCAVPLDRIEDWLYVIDGRAYGGYTINVVRSTLSPADRATYDASWGYEFSNPLYTEKYPKKKVVELPKEEEKEPEPTKVFGIVVSSGKKKKKKEEPVVEEEKSEYDDVNLAYDHPQALLRFETYKRSYTKGSMQVNNIDENGWTPLLNHTLAGNRHIVQLLVDAGADLSARTHHGHSAQELSKNMGWAQISAILSQAARR